MFFEQKNIGDAASEKHARFFTRADDKTVGLDNNAAEKNAENALQNDANGDSAKSANDIKPQEVIDAEKEPTATEPQKPASVIAEKKEIKLSPVAQALYDRMMAQRAHETLKAEVDAAKSSDKDAEIISENAMTEKNSKRKTQSKYKQKKQPKELAKRKQPKVILNFLRNESKVPRNAADSSAHKNPQKSCRQHLR